MAVRGRNLLDVSDLLFYLAHHSTVSGIQRVVVETLPGLLAADPTAELVAFDPVRRTFVSLGRDEMSTLLSDTMGVKHRASDKSRVVRAAVAMRDGLGDRHECRVRGGDVLAVLGAGWTFPGFFKALASMRLRGVGVIVLVYDLIPLVQPGFPAPTVLQFEEYMVRVAYLADRVPCISASTRADFETYCADRGWPAPPGAVTRLAGSSASAGAVGRTPDAERPLPAPAWPRPFVLMVSTLETRKNHLLALRAWERIVADLGHDEAPDLVCVGRLGWNVQPFLERFLHTRGVGGRVVLLTDSVPDRELQALYRECLFTLYPSRYEGWGLPVGESLAMGKAAVVARNSSLEEVGGDLCHYFADNDLGELVQVVTGLLRDPSALKDSTRRVEEEFTSVSWNDVAEVLMNEMAAARAHPADTGAPRIELGTEYGLGNLIPFGGSHDAAEVLTFIESSRLLPLTGQVLDVDRHMIAELSADGDLHDADTWGRPLPRGGTARFTVIRPTDEPLTMLLTLRAGLGQVTMRVQAPTGYSSRQVPFGSAVVIDLGPGREGDAAQVAVTAAAPAAGPDDGWASVGLESFLVLASADNFGQVLALQRLNDQLSARVGQIEGVLAQLRHERDETFRSLEMVTASSSWRVTAPLRALKAGRRRHP